METKLKIKELECENLRLQLKIKDLEQELEKLKEEKGVVSKNIIPRYPRPFPGSWDDAWL